MPVRLTVLRLDATGRIRFVDFALPQAPGHRSLASRPAPPPPQLRLSVVARGAFGRRPPLRLPQTPRLDRFRYNRIS